MRLTLATLMLGLTLAGCVSQPPAGSPPLSPRETASQVETEYGLILASVNAAVHLPGLPADAKAKIQTASHATTQAVHAYHEKALGCFRDAATGVVGNAPGKVCDQSTLGTILAVVWSQIGQLNGLLAAFAPGTQIALPGLPAS